MTLSTATITGSVSLPDGQAFTSGVLVFALTDIDTEGAQVLPPAFVEVPLTGVNIPGGTTLWRNSAGSRATLYKVSLTCVIDRGAGLLVNRSYELGYIQIGAGATYDLGTLLAAGLVPPVIGSDFGLDLFNANDAPAGRDLLGVAPGIHVANFGALPDLNDQTAAIQTAINYAASLGGGMVILGAGTYLAAALTLPDYVYLQGQGVDATILKLKNGANTWLVGTEGWANNENTVGLYGGLLDMTLDGNKANNASGSLAWHANYRFTVKKVKFQNSGGSGLVIASTMRDGTTVLINGIAETEIMHCSFQNNTVHGLYGYLGVGTRLSDQMIAWCNFYQNGGAGIYTERSVGWKIIFNQLYDNGTHAIYAAQFARGLIHGNNCDILASAQGATSITAGVFVQSFSTEGAWEISANQYIINAAAVTTVTKQIFGRYFNGATTYRGVVDDAGWVDNSAGQLGALEGLSGAAAASLGSVEWPVRAIGPGRTVQLPFGAFKINLFPSNITADRDIYFPNSGGTIALLDRVNQTFDSNITVTGRLVAAEDFVKRSTAPAAVASGSTLTAANLKTTACNYTGAAGALNLPTGSVLDAGFSYIAVDQGFDFVVLNTGAGTATVTAATGVTIVGNAAVVAGTSSAWRLRKTATATWIAYRIA